MIKVFEAFAGIGTQRMALRNIGVEHEVVAISEIDKYAIASYEAIYGPVNNLGDISKIKSEEIPDHDLFTYSFPCTDISVAGLGIGLDKDTKTRSSLLWECEKVIKNKKPKYLLMENVKNLISKKHIYNFNKWLEILENYGYKNYWQILNAKDYGIPQNRERIFIISILNGIKNYSFPAPLPLNLNLEDILEESVEEKFYLKDSQKEKITFNLQKTLDETLVNSVKQIGQYDRPNRKNTSRFRVYARDGIAPCITTMGGGGREPHVIEDMKQMSVRKLTPLECWRLMGIIDEDFYKAEKVVSNSQLYKQAGNAIVVNVLESIFEELFKEELVD